MAEIGILFASFFGRGSQQDSGAMICNNRCSSCKSCVNEYAPTDFDPCSH